LNLSFQAEFGIQGRFGIMG